MTKTKTSQLSSGSQSQHFTLDRRYLRSLSKNFWSIGKRGSGPGGALELHPLRCNNIISYRLHALVMYLKSVDQSLLLKFNTLLIFIPTYIPSNKPRNFNTFSIYILLKLL